MRVGWHQLHGDADEETEAATVTLDVFGKPIERDVEVPAGPTTTRRMLPVFRSLAETLIGEAVARVQDEGKSISCKRGCGACCNQLVPVSPAEAHALRELVNGLEEAARAKVLDRFADAVRRIETSGLAARLRAPTWDDDEASYVALSLAYFDLGIPCPFLDAEQSCSIHPDRPVICREFLVTSPAERCSKPSPEVHAIPLPGQVSRKLSLLDRPGKRRGAPWVPLTLSLRWAAANPEPEPTRTGVQILEEFFDAKDKKRRGR